MVLNQTHAPLCVQSRFQSCLMEMKWGWGGVGVCVCVCVCVCVGGGVKLEERRIFCGQATEIIFRVDWPLK